MYGEALIRGAQARFASPQSYEISPRGANCTSSSELMDNGQAHLGMMVVRDCVINKDITQIYNIVLLK